MKNTEKERNMLLDKIDDREIKMINLRKEIRRAKNNLKALENSLEIEKIFLEMDKEKLKEIEKALDK